jgi:hypothetical protein
MAEKTPLELEMENNAYELYEDIAAAFLESVVPAFMSNIIAMATMAYGSDAFSVEELKDILADTYRETFTTDDPTLH